MSPTALARIPVGIIVERRSAKSPWLDFLWRPVSVLAGTLSASPWTPLRAEAERALFYGGAAVIELHRTDTANYRDNLTSSAPMLWVILRPSASCSPFRIVAITADPAEGEASTDAGNDLIETVPMPAAIARIIGDFVAEHHVERRFIKRRRRAPDERQVGARPGGWKNDQ